MRIQIVVENNNVKKQKALSWAHHVGLEEKEVGLSVGSGATVPGIELTHPTNDDVMLCALWNQCPVNSTLVSY